MIGDPDDVLFRIVRLLPPWFDDGITKVRDATLQGCAAAFSFIYSLYAYAVLQTRIATASDGWLDLIAFDFFGDRVLRYPGQTDASFRITILTELFRKRSIRQALIDVLAAVTGNIPSIVEPGRIPDTCAYNTSTAYYNTIGAWGSRGIPYQVFLTIARGSEQSDADIYAAIEAVRPIAVKVWVQIYYQNYLGVEGGLIAISTESGTPLAV